MADIILSTTVIPDFKVTEYIGIVTGSSVRAGGIVKDIKAKFVDFVGGKTAGYGESLNNAVAEALKDMVRAAEAHAATAVMGVSVALSTVHMEKGGFFCAVATGTAVKGESDNA